MTRWWLSPWLWLFVYLAALVGIGVFMFDFRERVLAADPQIQAQQWDDWRKEAAKQDGHSGPVERVVSPTDEPPMLIMMRDHFPVMFLASIVFPAVILGFFLAVAHGVLRQASAPKPANIEQGEAT